MNVPAIRAALERLSNHAAHCQCSWMVMPAVVRVGLRACDECERLNGDDHGIPCIGEARRLRAEQEAALEVIADILREAGVSPVKKCLCGFGEFKICDECELDGKPVEVVNG